MSERSEEIVPIDFQADPNLLGSSEDNKRDKEALERKLAWLRPKSIMVSASCNDDPEEWSVKIGREAAADPLMSCADNLLQKLEPNLRVVEALGEITGTKNCS